MALLVGLPSTALAAAKPNPRDLKPTAITIDARPISAFRRGYPNEKQFGRLQFLGGLVLTSPDSKNFGGLSGLIMAPSLEHHDAFDLTAVSDAGTWLAATLITKNGVPERVQDARIAPLLATDGLPFKRQRDRDSEAIALERGTLQSGTVLVSFEQNSRIVRFDIKNGSVLPARETLEGPRAFAAMRRNNGLEAMTVMRGGAYKNRPVALSERLYDSARNHTGWIWTPSGIQTFHLKNIDDFDVTDIASLDDGTLFVLERRFRWFEGVKMRIRRIAAHELAPNKTIAGETLFEGNYDFEIDNMEGLSVHRTSDDHVELTILSDDNFNPFLQRTILLRFALSDVTTAKTRP